MDLAVAEYVSRHRSWHPQKREIPFLKDQAIPTCGLLILFAKKLFANKTTNFATLCVPYRDGKKMYPTYVTDQRNIASVSEAEKEKPTTPGIPRRSPIQVLTGPDVA